MSAFEALRSLRRQQQFDPKRSVTELAKLTALVQGDMSALDFEAALQLEGLIRSQIPLDDGPIFYCSCIEGHYVTGKFGPEL